MNKISGVLNQLAPPEPFFQDMRTPSELKKALSYDVTGDEQDVNQIDIASQNIPVPGMPRGKTSKFTQGKPSPGKLVTKAAKKDNFFQSQEKKVEQAEEKKESVLEISEASEYYEEGAHEEKKSDHSELF